MTTIPTAPLLRRLLPALVLALLCLPAGLRAEGHDAPTRTANPRVPDKVEFAGVTIDLRSNPDMAERLDRELTQMTYAQAATLLQIKRANRIFPIIRPILKANGVPDDLVYLACIESTLDPRAYSGAKAAGLWQFMPATGKEYGLQVDDEVDQRYDPWLSTGAAARYLLAAKQKFGDWETVAASYNAGMGRLSRELASQGVGSAYELWLPQETMRYIFRLLAAKLIMEHPERYGFHVDRDQLYRARDYREVTVCGPVPDWAAWAREQGTTYYQLREHNPWIRSSKLTNKEGRSYTVRLPRD